jgi:hypothetical protein
MLDKILSRIKYYEVKIAARRAIVAAVLVGGSAIVRKFYGVEVEAYAQVWATSKPIEEFLYPAVSGALFALGVDLNEFRVFLKKFGVL